MAAFDLQEQEQLASFKAWWHSWGQYLAIGVFALSVAYVGSKGWQGIQSDRGAKAADAFAPVAEAIKSHDFAKTDSALKAFILDQSGSPLAARGQLELAKMAFESGKLDDARKALDWVIANSKESALVDTASIRLANVLLDQKQYDAALAAVKAPKNLTFDRLFAETRGDILSIKGDVAGARTAYNDAIKTMEKDAPARKLIEIKLSGLGG
ncbi:tetratricopeptide repeat protein [Burkholderiaceae bacterium DAT-1]|nr:tetratricopeptide repeat protein [Burkholderiaceae bacterium DAT-1]